MNDYLAAYERAVRHLLPKVWEDDLKVADAEAALQAAQRAVDDGYRYVEGWRADPYLEDEDGLATMVFWETYFERTDERTQREGKVVDAASVMKGNEDSSSMLAGMVLEFGKRGITMVHGDLSQAPARPTVGTVPLREIIWQGRNQAAHWEDGRLHPPTQACFDALFAEHGSPFDQAKGRNLSLDILRILGWAEYEQFEKDMKRLK